MALNLTCNPLTGARLGIAFALILVTGCRPSSLSNTQDSPQPENTRNPKPVGVVDVPRNGDTVGRVVDVTGWATGDAAVTDVRVWVDGRFDRSAKLSRPRPDVTSAFPQYPTRDDLHGWTAEIDLGESTGPHTILVQAVDDRGAITDLPLITVTVISRH